MKKTLSMLLAIVMVLSMMPLSVLAAEAGGKITFTTTFEEGMTVGDTFTVTATLDENPGIAAFTNSLKWNDKVVKLIGFATEYDEEEEEDVLVTDFGGKTTWSWNDTTGKITFAREKNVTKTGVLYTASFEVIAGGELGLGLTATAFCEEFTFADEDGKDFDPQLDFSAIQGLVATGDAAAPDLPEDASFTNVTTDAGNILAIEEVDEVAANVWGIDYYATLYHVTVPAGTTQIVVTHPASEDPFCDEAYNAAYGYMADTATWSGSSMEYAFTTEEDAYTIIFPASAFVDTDGDWMQDTEVSFIAEADMEPDYALAVERTSCDPICFFTFSYAAEGDDVQPEEPETYTIHYDHIVGGSVWATDADGNEITEAEAGQEVYLNYEAEDAYTLNSWGYTFNGTFNHLENGAFTMPAGDVTVSAQFKAKTYAINISGSSNGQVSADKAYAAAGEKVTLTVNPADGYQLDNLTVNGGAVEVTNNQFTMPAGAVTISATFKKLEKGYTFATSADVSTDLGGNVIVSVNVTGHTDGLTTYNAYDLTLTFDSDKLAYVGYTPANNSDNVSVSVEGNTIRIVGCGDDKDFATAIASLSFTMKEAGMANVTVTSAQISEKDEAVKENAPKADAKHDETNTDADETPDVSVVVVPYTVEKPDFVTGADVVLHGEDYTFSYVDTDNYTYADLTVTVGGEAVTVLPQEDGSYIIENVTGAVEITATQTAKSYDVTKPENVTGADKATYGEDYIFTVTPGEGMAIESVVITDINGNEISYTVGENGEYVIDGEDITGEFTITITESETMTTITFTGVEAEEVEGGLTQTAEIGKKFTFTLNKAEGYAYTVMVGETELEEKNGEYTIPADLVVAEGVLVTITKADTSKAVVAVSEYITLDGQSMFLITAKWGEKVLAYGEETMFYSEKYTVAGSEVAGAYCWLVVSADNMDAVKAAAEEAIVEAAEGATATAIAYNCDVNGTTKVDVNDAQLVYDLYNARYMEFTQDLLMKKFLEADMVTDGKLDTMDVTAVISHIIGK